MRRIAERHRHNARVATVRTSDRAHHCVEIRRCASHRPDDRTGVGQGDDAREMSGRRHSAVRRLQCRDTAAMGGKAQAATGIAADADRAQAGRDRSRVAAATGARRARRIVRVVRQRIDIGARAALRLAEHDRSGVAKPLDDGRRMLRHVVAALFETGGADQVFYLDPILHREGHARERWAVVATGDRAVPARRSLACAVGSELHDRAEACVRRSDALQMRLENFSARCLAFADHARDRQRRKQKV